MYGLFLDRGDAAAATSRLQVLQMRQRNRKLGRIELQIGGEHGSQLLKILGHVAVVVERVHEQRNDPLVPVRALQQVYLPKQMLAQRG